MISPTPDEPAHFRLCSSCKRPLAFGGSYYTCSVSTCNRSKMTLTFCSVPCFQAHVPTLRHREAWAEQQKAPTREAWLSEQRAAKDEGRHSGAAREKEPRLVGQAPSVVRSTAAATDKTHAALKEPLMSNEEVLVVVSKVKTYIRARAQMNTADAVADAISDVVRAACDRAIERAKADGRKTVMARDVSGESAA
jgi:hypothetical protein